MNLDDLKFYRCPSCHSDQLLLKIERQRNDGWIEVGCIECKKCSSHYLVNNGLPRFVPVINYAGSFGFQWNIHARTQLDSYSGLPLSRNRVFGVTRWETDLGGQRILEAGSGAGRFTEVLLSTGADVFSFDYSSAVDANYKNNGDKKNLTLFQGDIFNVPLELASFDKVFCFGVLQHTPDPAEAFSSLTKYVRPGGILTIDVYRRDLAAMMQWKYLLRPITKRMNKRTLYRIVENLVPILIPVSKGLRKLAGRAGSRLIPIVEYSHIELPADLNRQWAILDTFDMYSPAHDHPQSLAEVRRWFTSAGFTEVDVRKGPNGVVGSGTLKD